MGCFDEDFIYDYRFVLELQHGLRCGRSLKIAEIIRGWGEYKRPSDEQVHYMEQGDCHGHFKNKQETSTNDEHTGY